MQLNSNILEQRWAMLTNPFALAVPPMCKVTELEIIEHSFLLDVVEGEITEVQRLTKSQMKQCRERFRRFCRTQWNLRSRN